MARYPKSRKPVKPAGGLGVPTDSEGATTEWALAVAPFPLSHWLFRTASSDQGRADFARRSEPLTARTILEDGVEGKGAGSQGYPPGGVWSRAPSQ